MSRDPLPNHALLDQGCVCGATSGAPRAGAGLGEAPPERARAFATEWDADILACLRGLLRVSHVVPGIILGG